MGHSTPLPEGYGCCYRIAAACCNALFLFRGNTGVNNLWQMHVCVTYLQHGNRLEENHPWVIIVMMMNMSVTSFSTMNNIYFRVHYVCRQEGPNNKQKHKSNNDDDEWRRVGGDIHNRLRHSMEG